MDIKTQAQARESLMIKKDRLAKVKQHDKVQVRVDNEVWTAVILIIKNNAVSLNDFRVRFEGYKEMYWVSGSQII